MRFIEYSHRHANSIIACDAILSERYEQFTSVLRNITDEDLINDFVLRQAEHEANNTAFKSIEPFETFKINKSANIVLPDFALNAELVNQRVMITKAEDDSTFSGIVIDISEVPFGGDTETQLTVRGPRNSVEFFTRRMIKFLEIRG